VVTVVPPEISYEIIQRAGHLRIPYLWMQPGSESTACINEVQAQGIQAVYGGPCIMVAVRTHPKPAWMHEKQYYSTGGEVEEWPRPT